MNLLEHYGTCKKVLDLTLEVKSKPTKRNKPSVCHSVPLNPTEVEAFTNLVSAIKPHSISHHHSKWIKGWRVLFGMVHGDLHGGNLLVDSRSTLWLIDFAEVDADYTETVDEGEVTAKRFPSDSTVIPKWPKAPPK